MTAVDAMSGLRAQTGTGPAMTGMEQGTEVGSAMAGIELAMTINGTRPVALIG